MHGLETNLTTAHLFGVQDAGVERIHRFRVDGSTLAAKAGNVVYKLQAFFKSLSSARKENNRAVLAAVNGKIIQLENEGKIYKGAARMAMRANDYLQARDARMSGRSLKSITDHLNFINKAINTAIDKIPDLELREKTRQELIGNNYIGDTFSHKTERFHEFGADRVNLENEMGQIVLNARDVALCKQTVEAPLAKFKADKENKDHPFSLLGKEDWEQAEGEVRQAFYQQIDCLVRTQAKIRDEPHSGFREGKEKDLLMFNQSESLNTIPDLTKFKPKLKEAFEKAVMEVREKKVTEFSVSRAIYKQVPGNALRAEVLDEFQVKNPGSCFPYSDQTAFAALEKAGGLQKGHGEAKFKDLEDFKVAHGAVVDRAGGFPDTHAKYLELEPQARRALATAKELKEFWPKNVSLEKLDANSHWKEFSEANKKLTPYEKTDALVRKFAPDVRISAGWVRPLAWAVGAGKVTEVEVNELFNFREKCKDEGKVAKMGKNTATEFEAELVKHEKVAASLPDQDGLSRCLQSIRAEFEKWNPKPGGYKINERPVSAGMSAGDRIDACFKERSKDKNDLKSWDSTYLSVRLAGETGASRTSLVVLASKLRDAQKPMQELVDKLAETQTSQEWKDMVSANEGKIREAREKLNGAMTNLTNEGATSGLADQLSKFIRKYEEIIGAVDQLPVKDEGTLKRSAEKDINAALAQANGIRTNLAKMTHVLADNRNWRTINPEAARKVNARRSQAGKCQDLSELMQQKVKVAEGKKWKDSTSAGNYLKEIFGLLGKAYGILEREEPFAKRSEITKALDDLKTVELNISVKPSALTKKVSEDSIESVRKSLVNDDMSNILEGIKNSRERLQGALDKLDAAEKNHPIAKGHEAFG